MERKFRQADIAGMVGTSVSTVSRVLSGRGDDFYVTRELAAKTRKIFWILDSDY